MNELRVVHDVNCIIENFRYVAKCESMALNRIVECYGLSDIPDLSVYSEKYRKKIDYSEEEYLAFELYGMRYVWDYLDEQLYKLTGEELVDVSMNNDIDVIAGQFIKDYNIIRNKHHNEMVEYAKLRSWYWDDDEYAFSIVSDEWIVQIPYYPCDELNASSEEVEYDYIPDWNY